MGKLVKMFCICLLTITLIGCESKSINETKDIAPDKDIVLEANTEEGHIGIYQEDDFNYLYDYKTGKTSKSNKYIKKLENAIDFNIEEPYKKLDLDKFLKNHTLIAPYTYTMPTDESKSVVSGLLFDNFKIKAMYRNSDYTDIWLEKDNKFNRLIISKDKFIIFSEISKNYSSSWTYINERSK